MESTAVPEENVESSDHLHQEDSHTPNDKFYAQGERYYIATDEAERKKVEIISFDPKGSRVYIHYVDADKRLDEWLPVDRMQEKVEEPSKRPQVEKKFTRTLKRKLMETNNTLAYLAELDSNQAQFEKARDEVTKVKNIQNVHFGKFLFNCWYYSPYPDEYGSLDLLHVCHNCFKYMRYDSSLEKHLSSDCRHLTSPPGRKIYQKDDYCLYEVDGEVEKLFCQNLCLFSKLFLDHKTLYYNVQFFNYYLLYQMNDDNTLAFVGYFSKEKNSACDYNLSCILTLPSYQRQGWGRFLIEFSYALTRLDKKTGTPEKPLSDLGTLSYRKFWCSALVHLIAAHPSVGSVKELAKLSGICEEDVHQTLLSLNLLKYWKDQYIIDFEPKCLHELCIKYMIEPTKEKIVDFSSIRLSNKLDILPGERVDLHSPPAKPASSAKGKGKGKYLLQLKKRK